MGRFTILLAGSMVCNLVSAQLQPIAKGTQRLLDLVMNGGNYASSIGGLIAQGTDPNAGHLLHVAVKFNNIAAVQEFLLAGADPNVFFDWDEFFRSSPHYGYDMSAPRRYDFASKFASNYGMTWYAGFSPLHIAAQLGYKKMVEMLLEHDAELDIRKYSGETPFMRAIYTGELEIAKILASHGADVKAEAKDGRNALHLVAEKEEFEFKDTSHKSYETRYSKVKSNYLETIDYLLQEGVDTSATDDSGNTPLHALIDRKITRHTYRIKSQGYTGVGSDYDLDFHKQMVELFIKGGASTDVPNKDGITPKMLDVVLHGKALGTHWVK